jgi:hypothetical protein
MMRVVLSGKKVLIQLRKLCAAAEIGLGLLATPAQDEKRHLNLTSSQLLQHNYGMVGQEHAKDSNPL